MKTVLYPAAVLVLVGAAMSACKPAADQRVASEDAVRAADIAWDNAFSSDVAAAVAFVEPTGSVLPPNEPIATGPEAVKALFDRLHAYPQLKVHWQPVEVGAAGSGDLAYSSGTYEMSFNDAQGKPVMDHGKYVTVWRKQMDGSWKVVRDIFNSDLPVPAPEAAPSGKEEAPKEETPKGD